MWYDDRDNIVAYVRWLFDGSGETWQAAVDIFDKPWLYTAEYELWLAERVSDGAGA